MTARISIVPRPMKHISLWVLLLSILSGPVIMAQTADEMTLKTVYFERFARHTLWPDEGVQSQRQDYFVLGILGENPFRTTLEQLYRNREIQNRPVKIVYLKTLKNNQNLNMLYIAQSEKLQLDKILSTLKNKPILTICSIEGAAQKGVHINFIVEKSNLGFEINQAAVEASGLKMSFHLLSRAKLIEGREFP